MAPLLALETRFRGIRDRAAFAFAEAGRTMRTHPRFMVAGGAATTLVVAGLLSQVLPIALPAGAATPVPPPMLVQQLPPSKAIALNAAIPLDNSHNPAADPFKFRGDKVARADALQCLALAVYFEAGNQSGDGAKAVAQVILNRVRHSAFPASVCGVVYEGSTRPTGCQFTFTCDGSLARTPDAIGWRRAWTVAERALSGEVYAPVGWATHYHANYVYPVWASSLAKSAIVGDHLFYRWAGVWGRPKAFAQRPSMKEAKADVLRMAALDAELSYAGAPEAMAEVADIPGAEELKITPSMRGDQRVAVRFHQAARNAANEATHVEYLKRVDASDNLKFALSEEAASNTEQPLGAKPAGETAAQ